MLLLESVAPNQFIYSVYGIIRTSPLLQGTNAVLRAQFRQQFQPHHVCKSAPFPALAHRYVLLRISSKFAHQSTLIKLAHAK